MSMQHTACVLNKFTDLSASDTLVLVALADAADGELGQCFPSVGYIGRMARLKRRAVQYALGRLEEAGYIHSRLRNGSSLYTLLFDPWTGEQMTLDEWSALKKASKDAASEPCSASDARGGASDAHMNQSLNQSLKQKNARAREADPERASSTRAQEEKDDAPDKYTGIRPSEVRPMPESVRELGTRAIRRRRAADAAAEQEESA